MLPCLWIVYVTREDQFCIKYRSRGSQTMTCCSRWSKRHLAHRVFIRAANISATEPEDDCIRWSYTEAQCLQLPLAAAAAAVASLSYKHISAALQASHLCIRPKFSEKGRTLRTKVYKIETLYNLRIRMCCTVVHCVREWQSRNKFDGKPSNASLWV